MAKAKNKVVIVTMGLEKETKNTFRYTEGYGLKSFGMMPKIGTLYLPKSTSEGAERIRVTVEMIK